MDDVKRKKNGKPYAHVRCANCNKPVYGSEKPSKKRRNRYCGMECYLSAKRRWPVVEQPCAVCGKLVRKTKRSETIVCNAQCQRVWAGQHIDWVARSKKAKKKWIDALSKKRRNDRYRGVKKALKKLKDKRTSWEGRQIGKGLWEYRIAARLASGLHRDSKQTTGKPKTTTIKREIARLKTKRDNFEKCVWRKKIGNKFSNMAKRRKRKNVAKNKKQGRVDLPNDRTTKVQMRFVWTKH